MKAMTFCWAPAPMESMATTAATPKIIPSIVRSERNLWLIKFSNPKARSGSHCCRDLGAVMELAFIVTCQDSLGNGTPAGIRGSAALAVGGSTLVRTDDTDECRGRYAGEHHQGLGHAP